MPSLRVVLDTNVIVSGLVYPGGVPGRIVAAWRNGMLGIVLSPQILDEIARVLPKFNHRLNWKRTDFTEFVEILAMLADVVEPAVLPESAVRDASDVPILGALVASGADYLVTGDGDLLALADRYPVLTPAQFWTKHGA